MSHCKDEGKDKIIFLSEEDAKAPSKIEPIEPDREPGIVLPDGSINWNCPCLGGMATGPCGPAFRDSFTCFQMSEAEPKGSDCVEAFQAMQECMMEFPLVYGRDHDLPDLEDTDSDADSSANSAADSSASNAADSSASNAADSSVSSTADSSDNSALDGSASSAADSSASSAADSSASSAADASSSGEGKSSKS